MMSDDELFVGYADTPPRDRRFFLRSGLALMAGTVASAVGIAALQRDPGPGQWNQDDQRQWSGVVTAKPYAMLRTREEDGSIRTAFLSCLGKCGVAAQIGAMEGQNVIVTGSAISRGRHLMIAVNEVGEWIRNAPSSEQDPALIFPAPVALGPVDIRGEILDSKCWFGAMRPSEGKVHKACASLCIRGGIPPAFFARDAANQSRLMILTANGGAHGDDLLPFVADPVRAKGELYRMAELLMLDVTTSGISRPG